MNVIKDDGHINVEALVANPRWGVANPAISKHVADCDECRVAFAEAALAKMENAIGRKMEKESRDTGFGGFTREEFISTDPMFHVGEDGKEENVQVLMTKQEIHFGHEHGTSRPARLTEGFVTVIVRDIYQTITINGGFSDKKPRQVSFVIPAERLQEFVMDFMREADCLMGAIASDSDD